MTTYPLTLQQIEDEVRRLAEGRRDHKYEPLSRHAGDVNTKGTCRYVQWRDPVAQVDFCGCIFGWALNRLGVPVSRLLQVEGRDISNAIKDLDLVSPVDPHWGLSGHWDWGGDVQGRQDEGRTWGYAVARADSARLQRNGLAQGHGKR
ncbi:hypothetical protein SEA_YAKULT_64 [Gordonia phage Yakult]|nr:hypothetical protein SEA_YAKULT_64 [Gordonia phage Yakult]